MNAVFRRALGALGLIVLPLVLHASARPVDPAASAISATFRQMNVPVEGRFTASAAVWTTARTSLRPPAPSC